MVLFGSQESQEISSSDMPGIGNVDSSYLGSLQAVAEDSCVGCHSCVGQCCKINSVLRNEQSINNINNNVCGIGKLSAHICNTELLENVTGQKCYPDGHMKQGLKGDHLCSFPHRRKLCQQKLEGRNTVDNMYETTKCSHLTVGDNSAYKVPEDELFASLCRSYIYELKNKLMYVTQETIKFATFPGNVVRRTWQRLKSDQEEFVQETDDMMHERGKLDKHKKFHVSFGNISHAFRCHHIADSLFSTDSGYRDFRGFLNLGFILLVLTCTRLSLENVIKYGILVNPIPALKVFVHEPYSWPSFSLVLFSNFYILVAYYTECLLAKNSLPEGLGRVIHLVNQLLSITVPAVVILWKHPSPVFSSIALAIHSVMCLKLYSYADVNRWCRRDLHAAQSKISRRNRNKSVANFANLSEGVANGSAIDSYQKYPDNISINDMYFYVFAPTLCYELNFPRSARIRKRFLIKRCFETVFLTGLFVSLVQQWIIPTINNSTIPFKNSDFPRITERLLKLAIPNLALWLMFFYTFFHSVMNINAEIMKFGDRVFYRDWWNAESVTYFWSNWNIPVHKWALRHVYKPLLSLGWSKLQASIAVFLISAFFHEYLVSVPLRMFRLWAFLAMLGQVPFAFFVQRFLHGKYGNVAVWMSIIIGQPFAVLMYYHDYYILNQ